MKYILQITLALSAVIALVVGCASQPDDKTDQAILTNNFNSRWAENKLWDDGLAEVATYAAERVVYGKKRSFPYTLITVKEDFNKKFNVKTDDYQRQDLFPVIKVNAFCRIPTDNYPYHYLTSLFFKRENPTQIHKITSSSQEWCGNTFKAFSRENNNYQYTFNSYWDNQGEGKTSLSGNILFEDQLTYTLRSLRFKDKLTFTYPVAALIQTNKANKPDIYTATFTVSTNNSGAAGKLWQVRVQLAPDKENIYLFKQDYPHIMVNQQTWDGRSLELQDVKRNAYWQH